MYMCGDCEHVWCKVFMFYEIYICIIIYNLINYANVINKFNKHCKKILN